MATNSNDVAGTNIQDEVGENLIEADTGTDTNENKIDQAEIIDQNIQLDSRGDLNQEDTEENEEDINNLEIELDPDGNIIQAEIEKITVKKHQKAQSRKIIRFVNLIALAQNIFVGLITLFIPVFPSLFHSAIYIIVCAGILFLSYLVFVILQKLRKPSTSSIIFFFFSVFELYILCGLPKTNVQFYLFGASCYIYLACFISYLVPRTPLKIWFPAIHCLIGIGGGFGIYCAFSDVNFTEAGIYAGIMAIFNGGFYYFLYFSRKIEEDETRDCVVITLKGYTFLLSFLAIGVWYITLFLCKIFLEIIKCICSSFCSSPTPKEAKIIQQKEEEQRRSAEGYYFAQQAQARLL